jgi:signal transduction histidine kinase
VIGNPRLLRLSGGAVSVFAIVSTFAVPLALATPKSSWSDLAWQFAIGIAITIITLAVLLLLLLVPKLKLNQQPAAWFSILIIAGLIRGYLVQYLAAQFEFTDPASLFIRLSNSALTTVLWVTLAAVIIELGKEFKIQYQNQISALFLRQAAVEAEFKQDFSLLTSQTKALQQTIEAILAANHAKLTSSLAYQHLINQVRDQVNNVLRPISHRLYLQDSLVAPKLKLLPAIQIVLTKLSFSLRYVLAVLFVTGFVNGLAIFGATISLLRLLIVTSTWLVIHLIWIRSSISSNQASWKNAIYLVAVGLLPILVSEAISDLLGLDHNYLVAILLAPLLPTLILIAALITLFNQQRETIIALLNQLNLSAGNAGSININDRRELATYIHNSLQSELLGISMQLAAASSATDEQAARQAIERLHATLTRAMQSGFKQLQDLPMDRLAQVQESWRGIAEIAISLADLELLESAETTIVVQLCEELISNAVRIGGASEISITGAKTLTGYQVVIQSNGRYSNEPSAGLGSKWISDVTQDNWQLIQTVDGVKGVAELSFN